MRLHVVFPRMREERVSLRGPQGRGNRPDPLNQHDCFVAAAPRKDRTQALSPRPDVLPGPGAETAPLLLIDLRRARRPRRYT